MPNDREYLTLSVDQATVILEERRFDEFKNVVESTHLDFKRNPYPIFGSTPPTHEKAKRDLVEDIVRFANVEGGIIILGVETEQVEAERTEVGKLIHPFPESRIDAGQYQSVIIERVKPRPHGVVVRWFPGVDDTAGLGAVIVPPQPTQLRRTFFATRTFEDKSTGKTLGAYIGYVERSNAEGIAMSAEELYQTFQAGRRFSELDDRFESLTERVDTLIEMVKQVVEGRVALSGASPNELRRPREVGPDLSYAIVRHDDAVLTAGLNERPTVSLMAVPGEAVDIPELFAGSRSELVKLLEKPPELRSRGFDLTVGERPVVVQSEFRRAVSAGAKLLQLSRDGVLTFVADAQNLLCWGTSNNEQPLRLNVLALAETTFLFAELVRRLTPFLVPPPETWQYLLKLRGMRLSGKHAVLPAGPLRSFWSQRTLPSSDFDSTLRTPATTDPRVVAYELRRELYIMGGFDEDAIPYVIDVNGEPGTDPEQIKEVEKMR